MKKIAIISAMALAGLGFTACNDCYDLPNPEPQKNPQLEIFKSTDIAIAQGDYQTLDLQKALDADRLVTVANITEYQYMPQGYDLAFEMQASRTEDFAQYIRIETVTDTATMTVSVAPEALEQALADNWTHNPADMTIYTRFVGYAVQGQTLQRLGANADSYYNGTTPWKYTVDRLPAKRVIADQYLMVGNFNNWDISSALKVDHVNPDADPYDDARFTVVFTVSEEQAAAGYEWKLVAAGATGLENAMGVEDATAASGTLVDAAGHEAAGVWNKSGVYMLSIDLNKMTYEIKLAAEYLYVPGQGSSTTNYKRVMRLSTGDYVNYGGVALLNNTWFLTAQPASNGVIFLADGDTTEKDGIISGKMKQAAEDNGDGRMKAPSLGLYYIKANVNRLEYSIYKIETISLIGAYNEWDLKNARDLTRSGNYQKWELKGVELPVGECKFCCNHAWAYSFGGAMDNVVENGSNFKITEAGTYDVLLDFSTIPYTATFTKK